MAEPMEVQVVSADRVVWSGQSTSIIAKTVDGEIGILPGHSPVLGVLERGAAVSITTTHGEREVVGVDGGFISVGQGRVSILSEYATLSSEISVRDAEHELSEAERALDAGHDDDETRQRYQRARAQVAAARKAQ